MDRTRSEADYRTDEEVRLFHAVRSPWLTEQVHKDLRGDRRSLKPSAWIQAHPFLVAMLIQGTAFTACVLGSKLPGPFPGWLEVVDPAAVLGAAWQVQATFAAIAFAGLTVLFGFATDDGVTASGARRAIFRRTWFMSALAVSLGAAVQLGIVATWFASNFAVLIDFIAAPGVTIVAVGYAYLRAAELFATPGLALIWGRDAYIEDAQRSIRAAHAQAVAQARLDQIMSPWTFVSSAAGSVVLARATASGRLVDVNLRELQALVDEFRAEVAPPPAGIVGGLEEVQVTRQPPQLLLRVGIGDRATPDQELLVAIGTDGLDVELDESRYQAMLDLALKWSVDA